MKILIKILFILSFIQTIACKECAKVNWGKFIVLGDSNTQMGYGSSWLTKISDLLQRKCDVMQRGFGGYNSTSLRNMLPMVMNEFGRKLTNNNDLEICGVLIMIGTNDSTNKTNKLQHVSLDDYKSNLEFILEQLTNYYGIDKNRTILVSPAKIDDEHAQQVIINNTYSDNLVRDYASVCKDVSSQKQVLFVDLYNEMTLQGDKFKDMLLDGIHFTQLGGQFLYDKLEPYLKNNIGNGINPKYPEWDEIKKDPSVLSNFCTPNAAASSFLGKQSTLSSYSFQLILLAIYFITL